MFVGSCERELSVIGSDRQGWKPSMRESSASSAVMLTDTMSGGAATQRDGLQHNCPIDSSQQLLDMHALGNTEETNAVTHTVGMLPVTF